MRRPTIVFIATIISISHVTAEGVGGVSFWRETFKMTCPDKGKWFDIKHTLVNEESLTKEIKYNDATTGLYYCQYENGSDTVKYYFYVEGRVCSNCFEVDGLMFVGLIIGDVAFTILMMVIIYKCVRSKNISGRQDSKTATRSGGQAQTTQADLYQPLSHHTRSDDVYSLRTG